MSDTDVEGSLSLNSEPDVVKRRDIEISVPLDRAASCATGASTPQLALSPRIVIFDETVGVADDDFGQEYKPVSREETLPRRIAGVFRRAIQRRRQPHRGELQLQSRTTVVETKTYRISLPKKEQEPRGVHADRGRRRLRHGHRRRRGHHGSATSTSGSRSKSSATSSSAERATDTKRKRGAGGWKKRSVRRKERNIAIDNVLLAPSADEAAAESSSNEDLVPPATLSPRSAAEYARTALKKAAAKRRRKKRRRRRAKQQRRPKKKKARATDTEADSDSPEKILKRLPAASEDGHFYPVPRGLLRRRGPSAFATEARPVVCSICQDMRSRLRKIDVNLVKVKRNLDFLESIYEGIFRKVNRLAA